MRDNMVVQLPRAFVQEREFRAAVDRVAQSLAPDVTRIITTLEFDWNDEPVASFMVIVSDDARRDRFHDVARHVEASIEEQVDPHLEWGVWPFFNFRSQSEQTELEQRHVA